MKNNNNNYEEKYLKYKIKYTNLKYGGNLIALKDKIVGLVNKPNIVKQAPLLHTKANKVLEIAKATHEQIINMKEEYNHLMNGDDDASKSRKELYEDMEKTASVFVTAADKAVAEANALDITLTVNAAKASVNAVDITPETKTKYKTAVTAAKLSANASVAVKKAIRSFEYNITIANLFRRWAIFSATYLGESESQAQARYKPIRDNWQKQYGDTKNTPAAIDKFLSDKKADKESDAKLQDVYRSSNEDKFR